MFDTVDSLIRKFTSLAEKLEGKSVEHTQYGFDWEQMAAKAQSKAEFHHQEAARATSIAAKIRNLVE